MSIIDRTRILIPRLISEGIITSQKDLAYKMGYNQDSTLSAILGGSKKLPQNFVKKLCDVAPRLNRDWIELGEGAMFKGEEPVPTDMIMMSREVFDLIRSQQDTISSQQRTIEVMAKRGSDVPLAEPATYADAE